MRDRTILIWLFAVGTCLMTMVGCCGMMPAPARPMSPAQQDAAAVEITEVCVGLGSGWSSTAHGYMGTGVAVDTRHVITAGHVAHCKIQGLHVELPDGVHANATAEWVDEQRDLALLVVPEGQLAEVDLVPPAVALPVVGERVCATVAWPSRAEVCGEVLAIGGPADADVLFSGPIEHGNSGAGVYDARGALVGIVTQIADEGGRFVSVRAEDLR